MPATPSSSPVATQSPAAPQLEALREAINVWHRQAIRCEQHAIALAANPQSPDAKAQLENSEAMEGVRESMMLEAARVYGDARSVEALEAGMVPVQWIDEAVNAGIARYLRVCSSGGMSSRQIDLVKTHVSEMLRLKYVRLALGERMAEARPPQDPSAD